MVAATPPDPFEAGELVLDAGHELFRVHSLMRGGDEFNPGVGSPTRFAFFGDPKVPVLYGADTERAAICESLLHDMPLSGGTLAPSAYNRHRMSRLVVGRDLRLAELFGTGLRRLGARPSEVTDTDASEYQTTVLWAEAAHRAGFDGIAYMSRQCNSDRAYVFFGDRVMPGDITSDTAYDWAFGDEDSGLQKLIVFCEVLKVDVHVR
ncbi:RES family NAD+ phosphorylase [Agromyces allii]|uniref:RES domain-containing protein n=1 Tax=Agromyces allii TaxID=393607 RepID=A0ABP5BE61_9MICO|nr:RES family NAD+ phosphorylase [Agromyces allii]